YPPQLQAHSPRHFPWTRRSQYYSRVSHLTEDLLHQAAQRFQALAPIRRRPMNGVGQVLFAFFEDFLKTQKGLRPGSVRSYRDTMKLFLAYVASSCRRPITRLALSDLSGQRVL